MIRLLKSALFSIPMILVLALIIFRATQDLHVIIFINYAFYTVVFIVSLVIILALLGVCIISLYKAILTFFNIKRITMRDADSSTEK
jgi:hypothetical protein